MKAALPRPPGWGYSAKGGATWPTYETAITVEAVGLALGLTYLVLVAVWWCWVCDLVDAWPEAFGLEEKHERASAPGSRWLGGE